MPREHVFFEDKSDPATLKQLQQMFAYDAYFNSLMFDSRFERLAAEILQTDVRGINMQYFNKPPSVNQPTPPHQDGFYFMLEPPEAVTMWLALEPVDEENGCIRYVRGSHTQGLRPHARTDVLGFSQGITDYGTVADTTNEVAIPAGAGDLLVHHALTIHRADGNQSDTRSRRALGLIYYSTRAVEHPDKARRQAKLNKEMIQKNQV